MDDKIPLHGQSIPLRRGIHRSESPTYACNRTFPSNWRVEEAKADPIVVP